MENPLRPKLAADDRVPMSDGAANGIWSLGGDGLTRVADVAEGPPMVLVRSEHVLMLAVELPPMASLARYRLALPFAIEDRIADPLDAVHVALGIELAPRTWLVGIVRHTLMRQWTAILEEAGLEDAGLLRARIVPDALVLPITETGGWSVDLAEGRAVVRAGDGTGFAVPQALLETAWRAAGQPRCVAHGDPLPSVFAIDAGLSGDAPQVARRLLTPALDLRQGLYAPPRRGVGPLWRRVASVAALGAAAHAAIAIADTLALDRIASRRDAEVRALVASSQPNLALGPDLGSTLAEMTPDAAANAPSPFLSLLARTGTALAGSKLPVAWRSSEFDGAAGTLTIEVETDSIADLQLIAQALSSAGLVAQSGAASTDQGRAVGTFAVRAS